MKKTVKGAIGIIAAAGLVAGGYFGYGVLGTKAGKVVNEVQSKVKQTVNSKDKKGQKNNTKNMNYYSNYETDRFIIGTNQNLPVQGLLAVMCINNT